VIPSTRASHTDGQFSCYSVSHLLHTRGPQKLLSCTNLQGLHRLLLSRALRLDHVDCIFRGISTPPISTNMYECAPFAAVSSSTEHGVNACILSTWQRAKQMLILPLHIAPRQKNTYTLACA
jgi:hypothetical protein